MENHSKQTLIIGSTFSAILFHYFENQWEESPKSKAVVEYLAADWSVVADWTAANQVFLPSYQAANGRKSAKRTKKTNRRRRPQTGDIERVINDIVPDVSFITAAYPSSLSLFFSFSFSIVGRFQPMERRRLLRPIRNRSAVYFLLGFVVVQSMRPSDWFFSWKDPIERRIRIVVAFFFFWSKRNGTRPLSAADRLSIAGAVLLFVGLFVCLARICSVMDTLSVWMGALFLPLATAGDLFGKWACPSFGKKKTNRISFSTLKLAVSFFRSKLLVAKK